jgi:uncharacterized protein
MSQACWLVLGQANSSGSSTMAAVGGKELIDAAEAGDAAGVVALLEGPQPPPIDAKDTFGCTALLRAACAGHQEVVALLLERRSRIETRDNNGWTSLIHSAASGRREVVLLLLGRGADVEAKSNIGRTALMSAALMGHRDVVALLLDWGARIEVKDNKGWTALIHSAAKGRLEEVALLLDGGADASVRDIRGQTAEHWATTKEIKAGAAAGEAVFVWWWGATAAGHGWC